MSVNWFEGGRRIAALLQGGAAIACLAYAAFGPDGPNVVFETKGPDKPFLFTTKRCGTLDASYEYPRKRYFGDKDYRTVQLCFRGDEAGVPWRKDTISMGPIGNPPRKMPDLSLYKLDSRWSTVVQEYARGRADAFQMSTKNFESARNGYWWGKARRTWYRFEDAFPFGAGVIFGLWVLASSVGFVVRGFAGVPNGKDFRAADSIK